MPLGQTVREWLVGVLHAPLSTLWLLWLVLAGHGAYVVLRGEAGLFTAVEGALVVGGVIRLLAHVWAVPAWPPRLRVGRARAGTDRDPPA